MAQALRKQIGSLLLRPVGASVRKQPAVASRRAFSSEAAEHEDLEEAVKWRNITVMGYVVCSALGVYNFTGGHGEEEIEEKKEYSYLHIRNKEFPWGPDGLFEYNHEHEE